MTHQKRRPRPGPIRESPIDPPGARSPYSSTASGSMDPATMRAFLARPLIARLATSLEDAPRVLPMWFEWDGTSIWMETSPTFPNVRILRANPRAALTIDESDGGLRFRAVVMRGVIEVMDGPADLLDRVVRRLYRRYLGDDHLDDPTPARMLADRHVLLRFTPERVVSWLSEGDSL
jgi:nitroimidazol reductase NimA-like FMN-containing flavoprotein (pyridoxamine 5'-phosphate oxidase superfamily)